MSDEIKKRRRSDNPLPSSHAARHRMQANRSRNTSPELAIQSILESCSLQFEADYAPLKGIRRRADIAFLNERIAVFIDGCFWHGCPLHGTWPKQNADFWRNKIETNKRRDAETNVLLSDAGWQVMRFWAHESVENVTKQILQAVQVRSVSQDVF